MTELNTKRLDLMPFRKDEINIFHRINANEKVRKFLWDDEEIDLEYAEDLLDRNDELFEEKLFGLWKITVRESGDVIGYAGLWFFFDEPLPELLYALLPEYWGQGYATEAARAVMEYAFGTLKFPFLIAAMDKPNSASHKVAQRLHMRHVETSKQNDKLTVFYRIDKQKFEQIQNREDDL